jgi:hypothetical protein
VKTGSGVLQKPSAQTPVKSALVSLYLRDRWMGRVGDRIERDVLRERTQEGEARRTFMKEPQAGVWG